MIELNTAQKNYLFKVIFDLRDLYKIFDIIDEGSINWLVHQSVKMKLDQYGWGEVWMDGMHYTSVNLQVYPQYLDGLNERGPKLI